MKKKGLGKGLDQLLPLSEDFSLQSVQELNIADIDPNESQPRQHFEKDSLEQLAQSIKQVGVLQPILVVPIGRRYRIVAGERRFRAARLANLPTIPAIVKDFDQLEQMEAALIENLQREDLNPVEEALALQALMDQHRYTQEKLAQRLGKSRSAIANLLRILTLPEEILSLVRKGDLSAGHARVLAGVQSEKKQKELASMVILKGLNVRQLEKMAADLKTPAKNPSAKILPVELSQMQEKMQETLGMRTSFTGSLKKGKITLQYYSQDELEHLYQLLENLS